MSFPISPTDGQIYKDYKYNLTLDLWEKIESVAFNASAQASEVLGTGWQSMTYNLSVSQKGTSYNSSTSTFTAPVDGWYQFNASWTATETADSDGTFSLFKNGTIVSPIGTVSVAKDGGSYDGRAISACEYLIKGEYINVKRYSTATTTTRTVDWAGTFSGCLIK